MKIQNRKIWLSANDTYRFATGYYRRGKWPCSFLSGKMVFVEFDNRGDLVDLVINNGKGEQDCQNNELMACIEANLTKRTAKERARFADCIR